MTTARPLTARARSAASQGRKPGGTPARVIGRFAARIFWRSVNLLRMLDIVYLPEPAHHLADEALRRRRGADRPGENVDVLLLEQIFEPGDFCAGPALMIPVEEAADQEVGFANAAVP